MVAISPKKHLKAHGWNIITIDIQWYEPLAHTTEYRKGAQVGDLWQKKDLGAFTDTLAPAINAHGAGLFRISPKN